MLSPADTFQIAHNAKLLIHHWGEESVVYNTASGDTHLVASHAAQILQKIAETPTSFASLKSLTLCDASDPEADLDAWLEETLAEFIAIDLIESVEGDQSC